MEQWEETIKIFKKKYGEIITFMPNLAPHIRGVFNVICSKEVGDEYLDKFCTEIPKQKKDKIFNSLCEISKNPVNSKILESIISQCDDGIGFNPELIKQDVSAGKIDFPVRGVENMYADSTSHYIK